VYRLGSLPDNPVFVLVRPRLSSDSESLLSAYKVGFSSVAEFSHRSIGTDLCIRLRLQMDPLVSGPPMGTLSSPLE
jgi:hypothetical protein